jgi:sugar O-acyltransferase (sialic acid O-acetyltransferase NeuD family)
MKNPIIIVGSGGHACSTLELIDDTKNFNVIGYSSDNGEALDGFFGLDFLGGIDELSKLYNESNNLAMGFVGKWPLEERTGIFEKLIEVGFHFPPLIHPSAQIGSQVTVGIGSQVHPNAVLRKSAKVGKGSVVNTAATIDHNSEIGDFTIINPNVTVCGNVLVGDQCYIGASATIIEKITVGKGSFVTAGSVVTRDVSSNCAVRGNPANVYRVMPRS